MTYDKDTGNNNESKKDNTEFNEKKYKIATFINDPSLLKEYMIYRQIQKNKKVLVIGNGKLVGEPVGIMLSHEGIMFDVVNKSTDEITRNEIIRNADVIISGVGIPHLIKPDMIQPGVILIDAGTSEQSGKLAGDIDPACADVASYITPVPGGVGPITVVALFRNLL